MTLDDALQRARRERDRVDREERQSQAAASEVRQRLLQLAEEAARRLAPYRGRESLHRFEAHRGPRNAISYRQTGAWWCWRIKDMQQESFGRPRRVLLLVLGHDGESADFAHITVDRPCPAEGQYVTTLAPDPVQASDYVQGLNLVWSSGEWLTHLEQDVAQAIVRYERTG